MDEFCTYQIEVRGRINERDLNAMSPVQMTAVQADETSMRFTVRTDQSGLIGLIRHLHERRLAILSLNCKKWSKEKKMSEKGDIRRVLESLSSTRVGFYSAILIVVVTIVTFGLAMTAIPIAGANCPGNCVEYPYLDTVSQYPKDFLWMFPAMLLVLVYVTLMVSIHYHADRQKKVFSQIGLSFTMIAAAILLIDYYLQLSVVPVSLMNAETEGLAMLIQYNPHGVFLVLEELGYLMMSLSFLFIAAALSNRSRLETVIRWIFAVGFIIVMLSLPIISISHGLERLDRFEVVALSVDWLILIVNGVLLGIVFGRKMRKAEQSIG